MSTSLTDKNTPDETLMQRAAKGGDEKAFEQLYNRYFRRLCGFFIRMLGCDDETAKDHTQELFTRIYINRHKYDARPFATWIYCIAYNMCKNEYRHRSVHEQFTTAYEPEKETAGEYENIDNEYLGRLLHDAIDSLPDAQREVFILRYIEEISTKEAAIIIGIPEGTVKSRLWHALATISDRMKKYNL